MTFYGRINLAMAVFFLFAGGLSFFVPATIYTTLRFFLLILSFPIWLLSFN